MAKRTLFLVVAVAVVLATAAGIFGEKFAAQSKGTQFDNAPRPSLISSQIGWGKLNSTVVLRSTVVDDGETPIGVPGNLGNDAPVVTRLPIVSGSTVSIGSLLFAVAGRPVIVMQGSIPAYRNMGMGEDGIDVRELQDGLLDMGYRLGGDILGTYGAGTATAVLDMYETRGFDPDLTGAPVATAQGSVGSAATTANSPALPASGTAIVPLGEVVFVPLLPQKVVALNVSLGGTTPAKAAAVCVLGSGQVSIEGALDQTEFEQVKVGDNATVTSADGSQSTAAVVSSVARQGTVNSANGQLEYPVTLTPSGTLAESWIGENVGVQIATGTTKGNTWIVPVAAVITSAGGGSVVTLVLHGGRTKEVHVMPVLVADGKEAVTAQAGSLHKRGYVVVGTQGRS